MPVNLAIAVTLTNPFCFEISVRVAPKLQKKLTREDYSDLLTNGLLFDRNLKRKRLN